MTIRSCLSVTVAVFLVVGLAACGGGGNDNQSTPSQSVNAKSQGNGTIVATVNFEGEPPEPETYDASGNAECNKESLRSREVVVNDNGTLKNVVVAVKSGPSGLNQSPEPVSVDQVNCMYTPHVVTAKVGQSITYEDSDSSMHNVRATKEGSQIFNITTFKGDSKSQSFSTPGVYSLECNVHPWMQGWVYVTDHGAATVTNESGEARLGDLPAGEYTLMFWHETYGTRTKTVTVEDGGTAEIDLTITG